MANPLYDTLFGTHQGSDADFLLLPDGGVLSYRDFLAMTARFAHVFSNAGLVAGDRLAVQIDKSPEALAVYAACVQAGLVFLPLNTAYKEAELAYFIENSGARLVLCPDARAQTLAPIAAACGAALDTLNDDGTGGIVDKAQAQPDSFDTVARSSDDLAAFLYTSGTTGRSKGAMLTQENLLSNAQTLVEYWQFSDRDVLLHALPIFHTHGLFVATNVILLAGGAMIFLPKFDVGQVVHEMARATSMMGVPTFYTRLLDTPEFTREVAAHMRLFVSGSAPMLAETHTAFFERTGHRILERYGMTETNMNTSNPYEGERRVGSVGFPLPGVEVRITDADGADVDQGTIGQIEVRGPNVFKGYWQMPEKTAAELRDNGFFLTGDLGRIDEDGYIYIVGRDKDLIISGGYNIYPKEIEMVIDDQPGVQESAVIGVPHADFGEGVVAIVVPKRGASPDLDEITRSIKSELARFKHPQKLIVLPELPKNTMGKVQKNVLREDYKDILSV
ncbi:malonyl-CoA synthase [Sulfitobacter sp. JL08]|uniref:malonate--CoA ligase n=1 Tax=Sulfitobacter sp. JL08 TaxID=2070369 RepID=UPI000E0B20BB|nr:malonyl-CoA synthase [Sulfitobacter sp. JL08]AXI54321.1 malonyl-CoA synthase [Sulfitobacter sp. JL08]